MRGLLMGGDDGAVGGVEALPFGVLVFVIGTLIIANAWGVVDAKLAVAGAAREAVRAYVEAPAHLDADSVGRAAAVRTLRTAGRTARDPAVTFDGRFARCARVRATVAYAVPAVRLPWIRHMGTFVVRSTASELVDPLRSGVPGEARCVS
ncbi:MAG: hypothetical protein GEU74_16835 [Nitriliruptorales bacterium]|nr:hypothetical protein [Nitriliruptorales bacterium]